ncbi:MAG: hypothetical protein QOH63_1343 [Acidobacteriota bacterium]|nr:hypothetical protein [Acidobacteriota bacterium]
MRLTMGLGLQERIQRDLNTPQAWAGWLLATRLFPSTRSHLKVFVLPSTQASRPEARFTVT